MKKKEGENKSDKTAIKADLRFSEETRGESDFSPGIDCETVRRDVPDSLTSGCSEQSGRLEMCFLPRRLRAL